MAVQLIDVRGRTDLGATGLKWPGPKMHPRAIMKSEARTNTRQQKSPSFSEAFKALFCIAEPFKAINLWAKIPPE